MKLAQQADAILLGAVGGHKWESLDIAVRPEKGLLGLRKELGLFANLRPAILYPQLADASTLKPEVVSGLFWDDVDITLYLANTGSPSGLPGSSGDWQAMMSILGGSVTDQIASVTILPNSTRTMAVVVDTDDGVDEASTQPNTYQESRHVVTPT